MIPDGLERKLGNVVVRLRSLLLMLSALRKTADKEGGLNLKDNQFYCKTLRSSGKLSCELTHRLDTIRDMVPDEEFTGLLARLGCAWDDEKSRASLIQNDH